MRDRYVVIGRVQEKDGVEEWAVVTTGIAAAVAKVNEVMTGFFRHNTTCEIFKLGERVPVVARVTEIPQPAKTATVYEVAQPTESNP